MTIQGNVYIIFKINSKLSYLYYFFKTVTFHCVSHTLIITLVQCYLCNHKTGLSWKLSEGILSLFKESVNYLGSHKRNLQFEPLCMYLSSMKVHPPKHILGQTQVIFYKAMLPNQIQFYPAFVFILCTYLCLLLLAIGLQMSLDWLENRFWSIAKEVMHLLTLWSIYSFIHYEKPMYRSVLFIRGHIFPKCIYISHHL